VRNVGLPGVHTVGDLLCLACGSEDGALVCLDRRRLTHWFLRLRAVSLIALPHLIGAPLAPESHGEIPAALSHRFVVMVTLTSLLFWALLGVSSSIAFGRMSRPQA
jgi:predicted cobalt transporter CbtA